ncbi:S1 family peptidase [Microbacterium sp. CH1]|uniref:S1 family peptidase n=1 Tax=Microbacterium sp. CH1 TaxID=1770208 RepID=UPI0007876672|nr:serine protease [Microbacterium sp. CH1]KYJ96940.1 hypothetical protein AUV07_04105 [Microbacterium sp. CH1]
MTRIRYLVAAVLAALLVFAGTAPANAISDGSDATESYPFMGAYKPGFPKPPGPGGNGCGVTLIDPHWGLTASHCRKNNFAQVGSPIGWTVQFGSADVTRGGEVATVSRFFQLPKSREGYFGKDLMLLRFDEAVDQTPIPVAGASPAVGTTGRILGWGNTATTSPAVYPTMLQEADVDVLDPKTCPNASDGELCVGGGVAKAGNADSGGPLLVREGAGWALAGVLSGPEQDNDKAAGLYTDVTRHAEWIRTIMRDHATIPDDEVDLGLGGYPALDECESSLVMAANSRRDDPALLLTNGHCIPAVEQTRDIPRRGEFLQNLPADGEVSFADAQGYGLTTARLDRLLFGTMTGTDVAVYRLDASFAELEARGATVLRLAPGRRQRPPDGHRAAVVHHRGRRPHPPRGGIRPPPVPADGEGEDVRDVPGNVGCRTRRGRREDGGRHQQLAQRRRRGVRGGQPLRGIRRRHDVGPPRAGLRAAGHRAQRLHRGRFGVRRGGSGMHPHGRGR